MVNITSKSISAYYSNNPSEYFVKFIHHNIIVIDESEEEYKRIEKDLNNMYNFDNNAFMMYFSDVDNYNKIVNHIDVSPFKGKIYLRIRNKEEYDKLLNSSIVDNLKILIDISDLEILDIKDLDLVVQIDKVSELPIDKLNTLLSKYNIKEISVGQIPYLLKDDEYLYDVMSDMYGIDSSNKEQLEKINKITNDIYSISDYTKILETMNSVIEELDIKNNIDGFFNVFDYIANNNYYDNDNVVTTNIESQNLIGSVLKHKSVCEGYSKFLQQMLSLIGIDSIVVQGEGKKEEGGHVWNQVFIDDKWYNSDVTVASYNVHHDQEINTYLMSDESTLYKAASSISHTCDEDYIDKSNPQVTSIYNV